MRWIFLLLFLLLPMSISFAEERPNVLFIAIDDLRARLGCMGSEEILSPNIDSLAARGMLFERAYCQQAVCNPSRASALTGMKLSDLRIWDLPTAFREQAPGVVTLPQHFKNEGYFTQGIGKIFHNWIQDEHKGDPASWSVPETMHYGTHAMDVAMMPDGSEPPESLIDFPKCEIRDVPDEAYLDGRIAQDAVAALAELKEKGEPFFLGVGFWKPHSHFNAPKKYWDLYERSEVALPDRLSAPNNAPPIAMHDGREIMREFKKRATKRPTSDEARAMRHGYLANTSYMDAQVGKVLDALKQQGLEENTIVLLWSDHGFHLGENGLWAKTSNFELDAKVPMIFAGPGIEAGVATKSLAGLIDMYPTLVEVCGLPDPASALAGRSLAPVLKDSKKMVRDAAFTWHPRPAYPPPGKDPEAMGYSVRSSDFRYTEWRDFKTGDLIASELYDHRKNSSEAENVVSNKTLASEVQNLSAALAQEFSL